MKVTAKLHLYTDGASRGNPGHSSGGVLIVDGSGKTIFEGGTYFGVGTNNEAEYKALLAGLEKAASLGADEIICHMDSELVVKQLSGLYRLKSPRMLELHLQVRQRLHRFKSSSFTHLPREHPRMRTADKLANMALDQTLK
jgi:ribonuclease HI